LIALAEIVSAASRWVGPSDQIRLFEIYSKAWREVPTGTRKQEIAHANLVFCAVFTGFASILETYATSEEQEQPSFEIKREMMNYAPQKFLLVGSFTADSIFAFCTFLEQFNRVFYRKGNILINRSVNWQLLAYGSGIDNQQLRSVIIPKTMKMLKEA
jgi:hypothetical protein